MDKVVLGSDFKLTLIGGIDLGGGSALIKFGKRSAIQRGIYSSLPATVEDQPTCTCSREFVPADIDTTGIWSFWLQVITGAGKTYISVEPYLLRIVRPGT